MTDRLLEDLPVSLLRQVKLDAERGDVEKLLQSESYLRLLDTAQKSKKMPKKFRAHKCTIEGCDRIHYARGYCSSHYGKWRRWGDPLYTRRTSPGEPQKWIEELLSQGHWGNDCILWPFGVHADSKYGVYASPQGSTSAHHYIYEQLRDNPLDRKCFQVTQTCGNSLCCNPNHLQLRRKGAVCWDDIPAPKNTKQIRL